MSFVRAGKTAVLLLSSLIVLGTMSGCASNFVRPDQNAIQLGKSTKDDVKKATKGNPIPRNNVKFNNETMDFITYTYGDGAKFWGLIIPHRTLTYSFFNNVLVGEEFDSTYDGEKTEFDTTKVSQLKKGLTQEEVLSIMGKPSGKLLYPLVTDKSGYGLVYAYSYARFAPLISPSFSYLLIVTFDASNVVTSISYRENGKEKLALAQ